MATKSTKILGLEVGDKAPRGDKMKPGRGWRLVSPKGRAFKVTLVARLDVGSEDVAVLRVLPNPD